MTKQAATNGKSQFKDSGDAPKKGDHYRCSKCGMEIDVTTECRCRTAENVHFVCCGQELQKV